MTSSTSQKTEIFIDNVAPNSIMLWNGTKNDIPKGWAICNGENGTPDLRDRFILGAGGTEDSGKSGDADKHTHPYEINLYNTFNTSRNGAHDHQLPNEWTNAGASGSDNPSINRNKTKAPWHTSREGDHTHNVIVNFRKNMNTGNQSTNLNRPKWYALFYIMKI